MSKVLAVAPASKRNLGLHANAPVQKLSLFEALHFVFVVLAPLITRLPVSLLRHFVLLRWRSPFVEIGRGVPGAISTLVTQQIFGRTSLSQARLVLGASTYTKAYKHAVFKARSDWVTLTECKGSTGRWIAPPGTKRSDDDVVLFYIHGGGFTLDTGANGQIFHMHLAKEMNLKRKIQYSVYSPDYELAPEFRYPSQLIEVLAGYHYLVNEMGVSEEKICLAGDSAGGNLATCFLLHLARPNPRIKVPKELGPTPKRPHAALIISPEFDLVSLRPSRKLNAPYDIIDDGACFRSVLDYVGATRPRGYRSAPTLNPLLLMRDYPNDSPTPQFAAELFEGGTGFEAESEGSGVKLLSSPYVNPSRCEDSEWWKEAMPGRGRTAITWGGKEIFADDDKEMFDRLQRAGVAPTKMFKQFGAHDWIVFDCCVDGLAQTKSPRENDPLYGVGLAAEFLSSHFGDQAQATKPRSEGSNLRQRL